jgi:predicted DNA-binding transcriptional regulator AlpA
MNEQNDIMSIEEVAKYLRKSPSWVYKHWKKLGGKKLGGSLFFPAKEDLYERVLFPQKEKVEVPILRRQEQVYGNLVQNKNRGKRSRSEKKGGDKIPEGDPNRHGLLGFGQ